jgi:hypothetical protein
MTMDELDAWRKANPTPASSDETLALKPNRAEDATDGPHPQISQTTYVRMSKPDGSEFLAPKANVPDYENQGYVAGAEIEIEDMVAYVAEQSKPAAEPDAPAPGSRSSKSTTSTTSTSSA